MFNKKLKEMIRQTRLLLITFLLSWILILVPKDCIKTLKWIRDIPYEE